MAYTQADLDSINQAIIDLATGKRSTRITIDGYTKEYQTADLSELKALKSEIESVVSSPSVRPRFVRVSTYKGL